MADDTNLNFDTGTLENTTQQAARIFSPWKDAWAPGLTILLLVVVVTATVLWAKRQSKREVPHGLHLSKWPSALRGCLLPLLIGFAATHAFSAFSVYYNTRIANASSDAYWETMGVGRLASLSHAHLFAHATMYFVMAALVQFTSVGFVLRLVAPIAALWAGVFDVAGWWGLKEISPSFEYLSALCGSLFSLGFLGMAYAIAKEAWFVKPQS